MSKVDAASRGSELSFGFEHVVKSLLKGANELDRMLLYSMSGRWF